MKFLLFSVIAFVATVSASEEPHPHGEPIKLMWIDAFNHSVVVDYDTIARVFNQTEVVHRKIVAVSINGALRNGKSFFMDYCLRFMYANYKSLNFPTNPLNGKADWMGEPDAALTGFSWKGGSDLHTTGVNMWSDIFLYEEQIEKYAIILLDTQGLFEAKSSAADNSRIFTLGTLISSIQIFNMNGVIQENQLEYLQMATDYAKLNAYLTSLDTIRPFQKLVFLMRDWSNTQDYLYGRVGGDRYINEYLSTEDKNQNQALKGVRTYINSTFDKISGYLLPHPGQAATQKDYNGRNSVLQPEFKVHLRSLIEMLLNTSNLVKKRIMDSEVTGFEYGEYMKSFFEIFQSLDTPPIAIIYETAVERQLANYLDETMEHYVHAVNEVTDFNHKNFEICLDTNQEMIANLSLTWFKSLRKMGTRRDEAVFAERLQQEMELYYQGWKKKSMKTWTTMEDEKKANEVKIKKIEEDNEKQRTKQKQELANIESDYTEQLTGIQKQTNLTAAQKEDEINKLLDEKEKAQRNANATINSMLAEHEKNINEHNQAFNGKIADLEKNKKIKTFVIMNEIKMIREMFLEMFKTRAQEEAEERKLIQELWDREDEQEDGMISIGWGLGAQQHEYKHLRKKELLLQKKIRKEERAEYERRYKQKQEYRKLDYQVAKNEMEESRRQFEIQMGRLRHDLSSREQGDCIIG